MNYNNLQIKRDSVYSLGYHAANRISVFSVGTFMQRSVVRCRPVARNLNINCPTPSPTVHVFT